MRPRVSPASPLSRPGNNIDGALLDHDGVMHVLTSRGSHTVCDKRMVSDPWKGRSRFHPNETTGIIMNDDALVTCVYCIGCLFLYGRWTDSH